MKKSPPFTSLLSTIIPTLILSIILIYPGGIPVASAQKKKIPAPELTGGTAWLNVSRPLSLNDLKGKMVLLDFWTYCCINCMHIIPDLKKLEAKYPKELVVIGVHAAKFTNERETENIRQAILRYQLEHPVVVDSNMSIWQAYSVRAWPTLVLIDQGGNIVGSDTGEGHYEILDKIIGEWTSRYRPTNPVSENPIPISLEKDKQAASFLSFPGKILATPNRLYIADSGHNRIVITDLKGNVLDVAGSGEIGKSDGEFVAASFHHPQGMSIQGDILYVADTENHLIRRLDLKDRTVKTIAGNGKQAEFMAAGGMGAASPLNSPWDLAFLDGQLYIAMAGTHQIWEMDLETTLFQPYAGSGREGRTDGPLDACALAQPSGIAVAGSRLYFADSEVSSLRYIDREGNKAYTAVGKDLFVFGDKDGKGDDARLQHPLGVAVYKDMVYLADTYNHKIKTFNPRDNTCMTFSGSGRPGFEDGRNAQFYEPGGLSAVGNKLYVADTNNHAIRVVDLETKEVSTLRLSGITEQLSETTMLQSMIPTFENTLDLPAQTVKSDAEVLLMVNIRLPDGCQLNPQTPLVCRIDNGDGILIGQEYRELHHTPPLLPLNVPVKTGKPGQNAALTISLSFSYCRKDNHSVCYFDAITLRQPISLDKTSTNTAITVDYLVKLP